MVESFEGSQGVGAMLTFEGGKKANNLLDQATLLKGTMCSNSQNLQVRYPDHRHGQKLPKKIVIPSILSTFVCYGTQTTFN